MGYTEEEKIARFLLATLFHAAAVAGASAGNQALPHASQAIGEANAFMGECKAAGILPDFPG